MITLFTEELAWLGEDIKLGSWARPLRMAELAGKRIDVGLMARD